MDIIPTGGARLLAPQARGGRSTEGGRLMAPGCSQVRGWTAVQRTPWTRVSVMGPAFRAPPSRKQERRRISVCILRSSRAAAMQAGTPALAWKGPWPVMWSVYGSITVAVRSLSLMGSILARRGATAARRARELFAALARICRYGRGELIP